jgi:DNA polymerase III delta prime subunit
MCLLGPSGTGKTTTAVALLTHPFRDCFSAIHVFSPSVEIDTAWQPVKDLAKHLEGSSFHSEWDATALQNILDEQRDKIRKLKETKTKKALPQVLICLDDWADRTDIVHRMGGIFTTLFVRARHYACSVMVLTQKLSVISTTARVNFRALLVWKLRNAKELESLLEELSAIYPRNTLLEMYNLATEEPYSFWYVDLMKPKQDAFFVRFEDKLVLE